MNRKIKKGIIVGISAAILVGAVTPLAIILSNRNEPTNVYNSQIKTTNFEDNIEDYASQHIQKPLIEFDVTQYIRVFDPIPTNASNNIYTPIFDKINLDIVRNDVYSFFSWMKYSYNNSLFKYKINQVDVSNSNEQYNIEIGFDILNPYTQNNLFTINQNGVLRNIEFKWNEVKSAKIIINSKATPSFFTEDADEKHNNLHAAYYFENVKWMIGKDNFNFRKFSLTNYSQSLNTIVRNIQKGKSYLEFQKTGSWLLDKMTATDFENDIRMDFENYFYHSVKAIGSAQRMLREVLKNKSIADTLSLIADDAEIFSENIIKLTTPEHKGTGLAIKTILKNPSIYELLTNHEFKKAVKNIVAIEKPYYAQQVSTIVDIMDFNDREQFEELIRSFIFTDATSFIPKEIINTFWELRNEGILKIVSKMSPLLSNWLKELNPDNSNALLTKLQSFVNLFLNYDIEKTTVAQWLVAIIKTKDETGTNALKTLLKPFLGGQGLQSALDTLLFDNDSIDESTLLGVFDFIANPTSDGAQVDYEEYAKTMKMEYISKPFNYDASTHKLEAEYAAKFTIGKQLRFNLSQVINILPSSIKGPIKPLVPDELIFYPEDYIKFDYSINEIVDYDLVKTYNGKHKFSWQALVNEKIDINLPQTAAQLYNNTSFLIKQTVLPLWNTLFFGEYTKKRIYKPVLSSKMNQEVVGNYNSYKKTGEQILVNEFTPEELKALTEELKSKITQTEDKNRSYMYEKSWTGKKKYIYKKQSLTTIDDFALHQKVFNTRDFKHNYKIFLNANYVVPTMSIIGIKLPDVSLIDINIATPYNVYSNNGKMSSSWSLGF